MEYCPIRNKSTLEISVHTKGRVSISRCSYLKEILQLTYEEVKELDLFSLQYDNFIRKKSSPLCTVNCTALSSKIENIVIGVSKQCNLNCYNCFNLHHEDGESDKELYFYLLEKAKGHNYNSLLLGSQGEVFTYYDEIASYLRSLTVNDFKTVILQTNATLLSRERVIELKTISKQTGIKYQFFISMSGITKSTYESTQIGANYEQTLSNIDNILKLFDADDVRVTFVLKKTNIEDAANIRTFFKGLGFIHIDVTYDLYDFGCREVYNNIMKSEIGQCIYDTYKNEKCAGSNKLRKYKYFKNKVLASEVSNIYSNSIVDKDLVEFENIPDTNTLQKEEPLVENIDTQLEFPVNEEDSILTVGITMHGNQNLSPEIKKAIRECDKISWIISNDKSKTALETTKLQLGNVQNVSFVLAKPGIENNRQNILNNTETKYLYVIDYDDQLEINQDKLLAILKRSNADILPVSPLEDGKETSDYIYYDEATIFVTTWAQIFKTEFLRKVGGYIQTWNFYHEEFGTNANMLANIYKDNIKYTISESLGSYIKYNHVLGDDIIHNSRLKFGIKEYLNFVNGIPNNESIFYKKEFIEIFKLRLNLMNLSERDYSLLSKALLKASRRV